MTLFYPIRVSTPEGGNFVKLAYIRSKPPMETKPDRTSEEIKQFLLSTIARPDCEGRLLHNYSFWFCDVQLKDKPETAKPVSLVWATKYLEKMGDKLYFAMKYHFKSPTLNISTTPEDKFVLGDKTPKANDDLIL